MNSSNRWGRWSHQLSALARKDLRILRPLIVGLVLLDVIGTTAELVFNAPDEGTPPGRDLVEPVLKLVEVAMTLAIAFIGALVVFVGERESKTDGFVATLPVEPRLVVASKVLVLAAVMIGSTWLSGVFEHLLAICNPDSVARRHLTFGSFFLRVGLASWLAVVVVSHAVWLSWLGRMGWLVIAVGTLATGVLPRLDPRLAPFGLPEAISVQYHGVEPLLYWRGLLAHSALAAVAVWLGMRLWLGDSERDQRMRFPRLRRFGRTTGFILGGALAFLLVLGIAIAPSDSDDESNGDQDEDSAGEDKSASGNRRKTVGRFTFTYRIDDEENAAVLMAKAGPAYEQVQRWLGTTGPSEVVVDLTYRGVELGGLALGARMNIDIERNDDADHLAAVFLHELVHVFQNHLSGNQPGLQEASLRFFSEGMAEHVTYSLQGLETIQQQGRKRAAWAQSRYGIRLRDLFDATAFASQFDERWLYDFGEIYAASVAKICGRAGLLRVYRRLGEASLPRSLQGESLLRAVLAANDCSFDRVQADVQSTLAVLVESGVTSVPAVRARYQRTRRGTLEFQLRLREANGVPATFGEPIEAFVMARRDSSASPRDYVGSAVELAGPTTRVSIEADHLEGGRFQYRVGLQPPWGGGHLFTRWRNTTSR
jgi:hypothetical protein